MGLPPSAESRGVKRSPVPNIYYYIRKTQRNWDSAGSHREPHPGGLRGTPRGSVLRVRSLGGRGGGSLCVRSAQLLRARGAAAGRCTRNMSNFSRRSADSGTLFRRRGPHLIRRVSCGLSPLPAARRCRPRPLCLPASASRRPQPTWERAQWPQPTSGRPRSLPPAQWSRARASSSSDETPRTLDGARGHSQRWEACLRRARSARSTTAGVRADFARRPGRSPRRKEAP